MTASCEFELVRPLGAGGMAEVHLARMRLGTRPAELVALKRMRLELENRDEVLQLFDREALISALLVHENVVRVRAHGCDQSGPFLALEYVRGLSASALLRHFRGMEQHLPEPVVAWLARDLAAALSYAHAFKDPKRGVQRVVHRDVSPDNVLIDDSGVAKLADFGIAKVVGLTSFTRTGSTKGKLAFMAPELFDGAEASVKSDLFSLGVTLFQLWCGVRPFNGSNEGELMRAVMNAAAVPLSSLRKGAPAWLEGWVERALRREPGERPDGARELFEAAERAVRGTTREQVAQAVVAALGHAQAAQTLAEPSEPKIWVTAAKLAPAPRRSRGVVALLTGATLLGVVLVGAGVMRLALPPPIAPIPQPVAVAPPPPPAPEPEPEPEPAPEPEPEAPQAPTVAAPRAAPVKHRQRAPSNTGKLDLKVQPWAHVYVDGTFRGTTPLRALSLPPGEHGIILVNEELNVRQTHRVEIESNRTRELRISLP